MRLVKSKMADILYFVFQLVYVALLVGTRRPTGVNTRYCNLPPMPRRRCLFRSGLARVWRLRHCAVFFRLLFSAD